MSENNPSQNTQEQPEIFTDATNRLSLVESPTKSQSSQGILKRGGRKSLGRRVSFAATAHVRVFNEEEAKQEAQKAAEAEQPIEDEMAAFRKQFEGEAADEELKNSLEEFAIKSSPMVAKDVSYEVDLKADEQPSFSSYISPEKDMMDLTGPVGNILDDLNSSPLSATSRRSSQMMDFTKCVGSILAQIEASKNNNEVDESLESMDSMNSLVSIESSEYNESADQMEMTQPVGNLVLSHDESIPKRPKLENENIAEMDMNLIASPIISRRQDASIFDQMSQDQAPFSPSSQARMASQEARQIVAEQVNAAQEAIAMQAEISEAVDKESLAIAKSVLDGGKKDMLSVFSLASTQPASSQPVMPAPVNQSAGADLKDFLNETGVRFLDNLSNMGRRETAGRPRDSTIMTPARRLYIQSVMIPETMAVERACTESVKTIEAQRAFLAEEETRFNHHPPLAFREFSALPPGESNERAVLISKLKTLKSVARLFARQSWYEWRRGFESGFLTELQRVAAALKEEYAAFGQKRAALQEATGDALDLAINDLQSALVQLQNRYDSLSRCDWEAAQRLHEQVQAERAALAALEAEAAETIAAESELRQRVEFTLEQRRLAGERVTLLRHSVSQFDDCTELALTELKSTLALQEALNGWRLIKLKSDSMVALYTRNSANVLINFQFSPSTGVVSSLLIESEASSNELLRVAAPALVIPEFSALPKAVSSVMLQLDRLLQLSRELSMIKVACEVSIQAFITVDSPAQASFIKCKSRQSLLPLQLTFFNFETKVKFSVKIGAAMNPDGLQFSLLGFEALYGQVDEEAIRVAVGENCGNLRRIVAVLNERMSK